MSAPLNVKKPLLSFECAAGVWASDTDTFKPGASFPAAPTRLQLHAPIVPMIGRLARQKAGNANIFIAPGIAQGQSEETRRNLPAFTFIVSNKLNALSGLKAAYGKPIVFPADAMEVKANWVAVSDIATFTNNRVAIADAGKAFHLSADGSGKQYALVSMHLISKQVPNWTWATFENRYNPARCDILGCHDPFGSKAPNVAPNPSPSGGYGDCAKTPALAAMFAKAGIDPVFVNYCLKGAQVDFTDNEGLAIRLGNSVTEDGFVAQSSCITCHSRAAWDAKGQATSGAGFDPVSGKAPLGAMNPAWYWKTAAKPPIYQGMGGLTRVATEADFVWSIPFCAYDDSNPAAPKTTPCAGK